MRGRVDQSIQVSLANPVFKKKKKWSYAQAIEYNCKKKKKVFFFFLMKKLVSARLVFQTHLKEITSDFSPNSVLLTTNRCAKRLVVLLLRKPSIALTRLSRERYTRNSFLFFFRPRMQLWSSCSVFSTTRVRDVFFFFWCAGALVHRRLCFSLFVVVLVAGGKALVSSQIWCSVALAFLFFFFYFGLIRKSFMAHV